MMKDFHPTTKIHKTSIIDEGVQIGSNCKIWQWVHICSGAKIGSNFISFDSKSVIKIARHRCGFGALKK